MKNLNLCNFSMFQIVSLFASLSAFSQNPSQLVLKTYAEGVLEWNVKLDSSIFSSPLIVENTNRVFVATVGESDTGNGKLYAINANSEPRIIWERPVKGKVYFSPSFVPESSSDGRPGGGNILLGANEGVYRFITDTGDSLGVYPIKGNVRSEPLVASDGLAGVLVVSSGSLEPTARTDSNTTAAPSPTEGPFISFLSLINMETGKTKSEPALGCSSISAPVEYNDMIFFSCVANKQGVIYQKSASLSDSVQQFYTIPTSVTELSTPAIDKKTGNLFVGDNEGRLWGITAAGTSLWAGAVLHAQGAIRSQPRVIEGQSLVLFGSDDHCLYAVSINNGELACPAISTGGKVRNTPILSSDQKTAYFGSTDGFLYAITVETGNVQWRYGTGSIEYSSPAVYQNAMGEDVVVVGSAFDHHIYAVKAPASNAYQVVYHSEIGKNHSSNKVLSTHSPSFLTPTILTVGIISAGVLGLVAKLSWNRFYSRRLIASPEEGMRLVNM